MTLTKHDLTEDRVETLRSLLDDAAKKVGEQRQTINHMREVLREAHSTFALMVERDIDGRLVPMHPEMLALISAAIAKAGETK